VAPRSFSDFHADPCCDSLSAETHVGGTAAKHPPLRARTSVVVERAPRPPPCMLLALRHARDSCLLLGAAGCSSVFEYGSVRRQASFSRHRRASPLAYARQARNPVLPTDIAISTRDTGAANTCRFRRRVSQRRYRLQPRRTYVSFFANNAFFCHHIYYRARTAHETPHRERYTFFTLSPISCAVSAAAAQRAARRS